MMRAKMGLAGAAGAAAIGFLLAGGGFLLAGGSGALAQAPKTSACKGLAEAACKGQGATCAWIAPKSGKPKAYCRKKAKSKK